MSRNKIQTNQRLFAQLDTFADEGGHPPPNAGRPRWIGSSPDEAHQRFLIEGTVGAIQRYGAIRRLALVTVESTFYVACVGFVNEVEHDHLSVMEVDGAHATVILSELSVRPSASAAQVYNAIGGHDNSTDAYNGHEVKAICSLFPDIRLYKMIDLDASQAWAVYWLLCLEECAIGDSWISQDLSDALRELTDDREIGLPYEVLARSVFDQDPGSLYLALYRCIEALYGYRACSKLAANLATELAMHEAISWRVLAERLNEDLGWYPKEAAALNDLLALCDHEILDRVLNCFEETPSEDSVRAAVCGRRVYRLRNSLVHFRPGQEAVESQTVKWEEVCRVMADLARILQQGERPGRGRDARTSERPIKQGFLGLRSPEFRLGEDHLEGAARWPQRHGRSSGGRRGRGVACGQRAGGADRRQDWTDRGIVGGARGPQAASVGA